MLSGTWSSCSLLRTDCTELASSQSGRVSQVAGFGSESDQSPAPTRITRWKSFSQKILIAGRMLLVDFENFHSGAIASLMEESPTVCSSFCCWLLPKQLHRAPGRRRAVKKKQARVLQMCGNPTQGKGGGFEKMIQCLMPFLPTMDESCYCYLSCH